MLKITIEKRKIPLKQQALEVVAPDFFSSAGISYELAGKHRKWAEKEVKLHIYADGSWDLSVDGRARDFTFPNRTYVGVLGQSYYMIGFKNNKVCGIVLHNYSYEVQKKSNMAPYIREMEALRNEVSGM